MKFLLILFLFFFGLLFGLEIRKQDHQYDDARNTFIDPTKYISRIEDGQFVFEPIHVPDQESSDAEPMQNEEEHITELNEKGAKMKTEGRMDRLGQRFGEKLSEITRITLEISFGLIVD